MEIDQNKKITILVPEEGPHMGVVIRPDNKLVEVFGPEVMDASDGYHTFSELYDHRITLYIALCKALLAVDVGKKNVWRARVHADGSFMKDWFVLGIGIEPGEQITYHLPESRWEETEFATTYEIAPAVWDGHTSADVLERLKNI